MITTKVKQVNKLNKVEQIPTQLNYNTKLNKRLNALAFNTLINRVIIIGLIICNVILFHKVNEVHVQSILVSDNVPQQTQTKTNYNVPDLPTLDKLEIMR